MEDDKDTLTATAAMLERLGCSVSTETKSLKALKAFSEDPDRFDLAILDRGMADLAGLELAKRLRQIRPDLPIVFYTGYLEEPSPEELEATGAGITVVVKPATSQELEEMIRQVIGGCAKNA